MSSLNDGLIGHWTFESLAESGRLVKDTSGSGNDGWILGTPLVVKGKYRNGLLFRGDEDRMMIEDLGAAAPATVMFWFNTRELVNDRVVLTQASGAETQAGALCFSGISLQVWTGVEWRTVIDKGLRFDAWQHIAVAFDGGEASGYLNGGKQEKVEVGFDFSGVSASIAGRFLSTHGNPYIGRLDDFRIYDKALKSGEIFDIYSA